ncbi:TPA: hypothetical protein R8Y30_000322 [Campylobacter jejuni]|nr:hypothetical protein [Campylobacter jejuni]HEF2266269.1 hypothetical protein [Campylobacter jejuni]
MKTVVVNWVKDSIVINDFYVETKIIEQVGYEFVNSEWLWDRLFELYGEAYQYLPKTKNYCAELKRYIAYLADVDDEPVFYSTNELEIVARKEINTFRYICKLILEEKGLNDKKINIILGE